jgi:drug/metabolite transporter (DMT)-like permease
MSENSSAIVLRPPPILARPTTGLWWGFLGVAAFSLTLPFTRVAVGGLSPLFVGSARAVIAAILAICALWATRQPLPRGAQWARLAVVGAGIVVGFPLLTSFALRTVPASHAAVVIAVLPAVTAVMTVLRGHEHPPVRFWTAAGSGAVAAIAFAAVQSGGLGHLHRADLLLFGAVVAVAVGYAEGGMLSRELGAWQTVSWSLVVCAPLMGLLTLLSALQQRPEGSAAEWAALAYLGVVSMFLGFIAWYRGLAVGPMAQVSQVQLVQPVMGIAWAGLFLGEHITPLTILGGLAVILCAGTAVRARSRPRRPG